MINKYYKKIPTYIIKEKDKAKSKKSLKKIVLKIKKKKVVTEKANI